MTIRIPGACAITGASGYVGSIIMRELQQHMPVVNLARHRNRKPIFYGLSNRAAISPEISRQEM
jgi:nucleoside-diphosphate-sugar epimerase